MGRQGEHVGAEGVGEELEAKVKGAEVRAAAAVVPEDGEAMVRVRAGAKGEGALRGVGTWSGQSL